MRKRTHWLVRYHRTYIFYKNKPTWQRDGQHFTGTILLCTEYDYIQPELFNEWKKAMKGKRLGKAVLECCPYTARPIKRRPCHICATWGYKEDCMSCYGTDILYDYVILRSTDEIPGAGRP